MAIEMTIPLLENPLIQKYFGCHCPPEQNTLAGYHLQNCNEPMISCRIIKAMCEPINKDEKYLYSDNLSLTWNESNQADISEGYHPLVLKLPSQFQPERGCKHEVIECVNCAKPFPKPPSTDVCSDRYNIGHCQTDCSKCRKPDLKKGDSVKQMLVELEGFHLEEMNSSYHYVLVKILKALAKGEIG